MEFILLIIILIVVGCSKIHTDTAISEMDKKVERRNVERKYWNDNVFDSFMCSDMTDFIVKEENAEIVAELILELSKAAPELKQHEVILYESQLDSSFTKKEKSEIIYNNAHFLVPFLMAKKGKTSDYLGVTFPQQLVINDETSWALKKSKEAPWGLSKNSLLNLNRWLERTLRENGVPSAKIVYAETFTGKQYCWEAPSPHGGERLW